MINLYIFNESSHAAVYGIGTYIQELTAALEGSKINVCIIHLRSDKSEKEPEETDNIQHWYIPSPINQNTSLDWNRQSELYYRNVVYLLQLQIKDTNRLVFHLNYNQSSNLAEGLKMAFECKVITAIHYLNWCFSLQGNVSRFRNMLDNNNEQEMESFLDEKKLFEIVDRVICLSSFTKEILLKDYRITPDKVSVIYNGLTDSNRRYKKHQLRKQYRFPTKSLVVLFAGRLDESKGLQYLLPAFRKVLETIPSCRLLMAGNGAFDIYMKECEDIWMHVTWTGLIDKNKLYDLYSIAEIGVMPSTHEQCSYVAIEMMMHGVPLIASTSTGLCEMVEESITGLHIPVIEYPDKVEIDENLLAEKMLYLLQHPEERKQMGINARERYEKYYNSKMMGEQMIELYQSL